MFKHTQMKKVFNIVLCLAITLMLSSFVYAFEFDITYKNAWPIIQELSVKENKSGNDYLRLGWAYYGFKNKINEARENFELAVKTEPNLYEAYFLLGILHKSRGEQEKAFEYWVKCLEFDRIENALVTHDILKLDLSHGQIKRIISKYEELIVKTSNDLLRANILYCMAAEYAALGDIKRAKEIYSQVGLIKEWKVIGPFDNKERIGFNVAYPPEQEINFDAVYDGLRTKVSWIELVGTELADTVNFNSIFYPNEWVVAYALVYIYSENEQKAAIRVGGDDAVKVWLNDRVVIENEKDHAFILDQYAAGIVLHKGWNKLLVKDCEVSGEWRFGLRITDLNGKPLPNLRYSRDQQEYRSDSSAIATISAQPEAVTICGMLRKKIKDCPTDYVTAYILAEWLRLLDLKKESIDEFERLVQAEQHCAIFRFGLANIELNYGNREKALANYKETIVEDPEHVETLMQIAYYFYESKMYEQALQYIDKASKISPNYIDIYILKSKIYEDRKWNKDAFDEAQRGLSLYPESIRMLHRAGISAINSFNVKKGLSYFEEIMRLNKWFTPHDYPELTSMYGLLENTETISKIYLERMDYYSYDTSFYNGIIFFELIVKDYQKAIEYCDVALKISPSNFSLLEYKGEAYYCLGMVDKAIEQWEKAVRLEPDSARLRERINSLKGKEGGSVFTKYSRSEENIKKIIDENDTAAKYVSDGAVILLDQQIYDVQEDGSCDIMVHNIINIKDASVIKEFNQIWLPVRDVVIEKAIVKNPWKTPIEITAIDLEKGFMYPPELMKGSIIEYRYRYHNIGMLVKGCFYSRFVFKNRFPIYEKEVIVNIPKKRDLKIYKTSNEIQYQTEVFNDKQVHIWNIRYADSYKFENDMPDLNNFSPQVYVSDIPSWEYLAQWENNLIDDQLEIDNAIKKELDLINYNKNTTEEKAMAIYNYLNYAIHYVALNHELYGWKPNRATKIFKDKYGDCKDKSVLFIAMLKNIGVDSYLVLLFTKPFSATLDKIPMPEANHTIVYVPVLGNKKDLFLDLTTPGYNLGTLPHFCEGVQCVILTRPGYKIVTTPRSSGEENYCYTKIDMSITKDKQMKFDLETNWYGQCAGAMRFLMSSLAADGTTEQYLKGMFNKIAPGLITSKYWPSHIYDLDRPFTIYAEFTSPPILKNIGTNRWEMCTTRNSSLFEQFLIPEDRKNDVDISMAWGRIVEDNFVLPDGFAVISMPKDQKVENELILYERTYKIENKILKFKRKFTIKNAMIKKESFKTFNEILLKIRDLEQEGVVFQDKKGIL